MDDIFANKLLFILSMFINLLWKGMSNKINYIIQDNDKRNMPSLSKPGVNKQSLGVLDIWLNARGVKSKPPRWHINLPIAHSVRENVTYRVAIIFMGSADSHCIDNYVKPSFYENFRTTFSNEIKYHDILAICDDIFWTWMVNNRI